MVVKVVDGALAGDNGLDEEAEVGEHGKAPVLDLLDLQSSSTMLVRLAELEARQTQRGEG